MEHLFHTLNKLVIDYDTIQWFPSSACFKLYDSFTAYNSCFFPGILLF